MEKYKQLVEQLYIVQKNEKILGSFWNQTRTLMIYHVTQYQKKPKTKKVWGFFKKQGRKLGSEDRLKKKQVIMIH